MGTALAQVVASNGHHVLLWSIEHDVLEEIRDKQRNTKYLDAVPLHENIEAVWELDKSVEGARLVIGPHGALEGCQILGAGEVVVHGSFTETGNSPGIVGPKSFTVGKDGYVSGSVKQAPQLTRFGFERGCVLRLKIQK